MKDSKLIICLNTMDNKSFLEFGRFVKTPFHNRDEKLGRLYDFYKKHRKGIIEETIIEEKVNKEFAFKYICPKEKYSPRKMRDVMSDLTLLWEDFIVIKKIKKDKAKREALLLEYYQEEKCEKFFFQSLHKQLGELDEIEYGDAGAYLKKFQLNKRLYDTPFTLKMLNAGKILGDAVHDLDQFYLIRKLHYSLEILNRRRIMQDKSIEDFLPEAYLKELEASKYWDNAVIKCYIYGIHLMKDWNARAYFDFKKAFFESKKQISKDIHGVVYIMLINFALRHVFLESTDFKEEGRYLYKIGIEEEVFEDNGILPHNYFVNAISLASSNKKELDWIDFAIKNYAYKVQEKYRKDVVNFSYAYLYFGKGMFENVLEVLNEISFEEQGYKLRVKTFLIRSYLELYLQGKEYPIFSACESFRLFLRREKTYSDSVKAPYYNFINYVKKIVQYWGTDYNRELLIAEIKNEPQLFFKEWLVEKIQVSF